MGVIDHSSYIPLYVQIIEYLTSEIEQGKYKEGQQIPPETTLAAELGVSRITVTNAIQRMVQEGTLYRIQGKGTFVAAQKVEHRLTSLVSFTEDMVSRGYKPRSTLVGFDLVVPSEKIKEKLALNQDDMTWKIRRVRYADDEPMAIQTAYLPEKVFPKLKREMLEEGSLYKALQTHYNVEMLEAEEMYRVVVLRKDEANLLKVSAESPALHSIRISSLKDKRKFEYTESILRGDRYVLYVKMTM